MTTLNRAGIAVLLTGLLGACGPRNDATDGGTGGDAGPTELLTQLAEFKSPCAASEGHGLTFMDGHLWVGCAWALYETDPETLQILVTHSSFNNFISADKFDGLAFDGRLWNVGWELDKVVHFRTHPPQKGSYDSWHSNSANAGALTWDGTRLWANAWETTPKNTNYIFSFRMADMKVDQKIEQTGTKGGYGIGGLAWDSTRSRMWSAGNDKNGLWGVVVLHNADATLSWDATHRVNLEPAGLAFDGTCLWMGGHQNSDGKGFIRKFRINR